MATENNGDRKPAAKIGVYEHPETKQQLVATEEAHAEGFMQVGFVYVSEKPKTKTSQTTK